MANNKNPKDKQPGENPDGTYHFNPGNMAGKTPGDAEETEKIAALRTTPTRNRPPSDQPNRDARCPSRCRQAGHDFNRGGQHVCSTRGKAGGADR